jgi:hypothetical protein
MPRLLTGQEIWKSLSSLQVFRQVSGGGSTSAAAALTAGATVANFTATTSFTASDPLFIVGASGTELNAIGAAITPTTAVPLLYPVAQANPSGSQLIEAVATDPGHLTQEGIQLSPSTPLNPVFSALGHLPIAYLRGYGELLATFMLTGFNILNLQTMLGMTEAEGGAGTSADPYRGAFSGGNVGTQGIQCLRATGVRQDGSTVLVDLNNAFIEPQGAIPLSRGVVAPIPMQVRFTTAIVRLYS